MKMKLASNSSRGLTLLELLVGVAILAMLVAIAAPSLRDWIITQRVKAVASELVTDLQMARTESVSRNWAIWITFKSTPSLTCYTVHTGGNQMQDCDCSLPTGTSCTNANGMTELKTTSVDTISEVSISSDVGGGIQRYLPNGQINLAAPAMNVVISGGGSKRLVVVSSAQLRRPSICAPAGSTISGYQPCS